MPRSSRCSSTRSAIAAGPSTRSSQRAGHLGLIVDKVQDKLTGKEEVVFEAEEVARAAADD
jgi:hypothetical protein